MSVPGAPRWLDGRLLEAHESLPTAQAKGVFETLRCERGALFFVRAHLARLAHGAHVLGLPWPPPWDPLAALCEVARVLGPDECALRLTFAPPHLVVIARAVVPPASPATALLAEPGAVELPRPFGVKTTQRAAYDALRVETLRTGAFDALVRDRAGALVESTIANVFVARAGELATPPLASGALPGIVRAALLTELERAPLGDGTWRTWRAAERALTAADLASADEIVLTNSVVGVLGLARLGNANGGECLRDDLPGAAGALARALSELLARLEAATRDAPGSAPAAGDTGSSRPDPA